MSNPYNDPNQPQQPVPPQYQPQQPYPGQQYQPAPQPKKKRRVWPWIIGIVVVLALCGIVGAIANSAPQQTAATTPAATSAATTASVSTSAPTQAPASKVLTWKTIKTFKGTGSEKTDTFTVPNTWKLTWTCDPASFQNIQYNVAATVEDSSGTMVDSGVNALCKTGSTSGETNVTSGGTVRLDILSEGDWTFNIQTQQ